MKTNELRVDNWVEITSNEGNEYIQCNVNTIKMVERGLDFIIPIPLTEEWLIKLGFKEVEEGAGFHAPYFNIGINGECLDVLFLRHYYGGGFIWGFHTAQEKYIELGQPKNIEYVHELQNFYFALTGEELTIKDT